MICRRLILIVGFTLVAGCQSQLMLMPTPEVLKDPRFDLFAANPQPLATNEITTLYVTSRKPAEGNEFFLGREDAYLHFGTATLMIGDKTQNLRTLIQQSTIGDREDEFSWSLMDAVVLGESDRPSSLPRDPLLPPTLTDYFEKLNAAIADKDISELTIYVHGANNTFYWSVAQGAQFQFFTGDNAMVMTFAWPSPGSIFRYGADKRKSDSSAIDLAYLLELLGHHSNASRINIVAYSAGGRVVGRALTQLAERYDDADDLRLGHVYLTQSDQPLQEFADGLPMFFGLLQGLTVTAAAGDPVLSMARLTDFQARLGEAGEGSDVELDLDEEHRDQIMEILNSDNMVFIDLREIPVSEYRFTHGAWYENSWVSTDVLVALLGDLSGAERGLESSIVDGVRVWTFPPDYLERVKESILNRRGSEGDRLDP